jgi:hypothetical protein
MIRPAFRVLLRAPEVLLLVLLAAVLPVLALVLFTAVLLSPRGVHLIVLGALLTLFGQVGATVLAFLGVPFFAYFGGLLSCGAFAAALAVLRGERASLLAALAAMGRCSGRLLSMVGLAFDPAHSPFLVWALVVMVAEDVSYERALERARALRLDSLSFRLVPADQEGYYGLAVVFAWMMGMAWCFGGDMSTTAGVMLRLFGPAAGLGLLMGLVFAALSVVVQASLYLQAVGEAPKL